MKVVKALSKISSKLLDGLLRKLLVLLNQLEEISSGAVLENNPEMVASFVPIIKLEDVSVLKTVENPDFVENLFPAVLLDALDCHVIDGLLLSTFVNY
jgi:hypothetical protein